VIIDNDACKLSRVYGQARSAIQNSKSDERKNGDTARQIWVQGRSSDQ